MGDKMLAEDILQETFIQAHAKWHQLKNEAAAQGWLKQIAVNKCMAHFRRNETFYDIENLNVVQEETAVEKTLNFREINAQIQLLPKGCREIFVLFLLEDYSHKQIAEMLGVSESTSKTQYHRAKQLMQEKLKPMLNYG